MIKDAFAGLKESVTQVKTDVADLKGLTNSVAEDLRVIDERDDRWSY